MPLKQHVIREMDVSWGGFNGWVMGILSLNIEELELGMGPPLEQHPESLQESAV